MTREKYPSFVLNFAVLHGLNEGRSFKRLSRFQQAQIPSSTSKRGGPAEGGTPRLMDTAGLRRTFYLARRVNWVPISKKTAPHQSQAANTVSRIISTWAGWPDAFERKKKTLPSLPEKDSLLDQCGATNLRFFEGFEAFCGPSEGSHWLPAILYFN